MNPATFWKLVPVVLLGSTVAFGAWRVAVVLDDPSFAVEEDYYERGEHWDDEIAARAASAALGWNVTLEAEAVAVGDGGEDRLVLVVGNTEGPVTGLTGEVQAFHNADPAHPREAVVEELGDGRYRFGLDVHRPGLWQWRVVLRRGDQTWRGTLRREVGR